MHGCFFFMYVYKSQLDVFFFYDVYKNQLDRFVYKLSNPQLFMSTIDLITFDIIPNFSQTTFFILVFFFFQLS